MEVFAVIRINLSIVEVESLAVSLLVVFAIGAVWARVYSII
ncbi:hypothetical protein VIA_001431 [Vibrio orientalis CIP 102891 = ATCC 33934]|uniref:Uncharacterized protein n=1 Tax=Vibrio orientalis CIP 102891 = ATCC 33934 TaxID=675816 RepID=A0ABM9Z3X6_VIBOR|nr:hypothetical protein VIA_001431 [Vibrio orientalis CIP 102891 = ATCC 33934]